MTRVQGRLETALVVSTDDGAVSVLAEFLDDWGCRVDLVRDAPSAFRKLEEARYDIVVLDTGLATIDVERFDTEIRNRSTTMHDRLVYLAEAVEDRRDIKRFLRTTDRPIVPKPMARPLLTSSVFVAAGVLREDEKNA